MRDLLCLAQGKYTPASRSQVGTFLIVQAFVYIGLGLTYMFFPRRMWGYLLSLPDTSTEQGFMRAWGFTIVGVGCFYFFQGLSDNKHWALMSTFDRPWIVLSMFTLFCGCGGYVPMNIALFQGFVDLSLALATLYEFYDDGRSKDGVSPSPTILTQVLPVKISMPQSAW